MKRSDVVSLVTTLTLNPTPNSSILRLYSHCCEDRVGHFVMGRSSSSSLAPRNLQRCPLNVRLMNEADSLTSAAQHTRESSMPSL